MRERKPNLQDLADEMALVVAQANTAWARVENAMCTLLESFIGHTQDHIAAHIYFAPNNTETRFKIVDTIAKLKFTDYKPHDLLTEWLDLKLSIDKAKETRNRIAHSEINVKSRTNRGTIKWQARLTASSFDVGRHWKEHKPRQWPGMSAKDVKATADRFFWLAVRVEEIARYWRTYSLEWTQPPLREIYRHIRERRRSGGPLPDDQNSPKPEDQPLASQ